MKKQRPERLLPISQANLAAYLGLSSTQLSMSNSGKYPGRQLSSTAAEKWTRLNSTFLQQSALPGPTPSLQKLLHKQATACSRLATEAAGTASYTRAGLFRFTDKLEKMKAQYAAATGWIKTLDCMLATLPVTKEHEGDMKWAACQLNNIMAAMKKYDVVAQAKLEARIALERAKAGIYEVMSQKLLAHE